MIITKAYAQALIRDGKARAAGKTSGGDCWPDPPTYVIVERLDMQRVDHYQEA